MNEIAIVDDNHAFYEHLSGLSIEYICSCKIAFDATVYFDAASLIENINNDIVRNLIFLDVGLCQMCSISTTDYLRNIITIQMRQIVYILFKREYTMQLFRSRAP